MLQRLWSFRREVLGTALYWTGVSRMFETLAQSAGAIILMYHSISDNETADFIDPRNRLSRDMFERQMAFLSKRRRVTALSNLVDQIESGVTPSAGTVCVTFDDGYLDNLKIAAPILEKFKLPATLFLATGYIGRGETQWADVLHWLFHRRTANRLNMPLLGNIEIDLTSKSVRIAVHKRLHLHLLEVMQSKRRELLMEIQRQLRPEGPAPRLTLTWDDVRELRSRYPLFDIGGHTREHVDLRTHGGDIARAEIDGCAEDIRRELVMQPQHFSFPYGRWSAETRLIVSTAGWRSAVGAGANPRIGQASDRFAMPRVDAPRTMTDLRFKTSGAYPGIFSAFGLS